MLKAHTNPQASWEYGEGLAVTYGEPPAAPIDLNERDAETNEWVFGEKNDFPETPVKLAYLLLSSTRTGSSMLCSSLRATRLAGNPMEYLNKRYMEFYARVRGATQLNPYLAELVKRRTSPNGRFGLKLHAFQFTDMFGKDPQAGVTFLKNFSRFILIYRRNKLDQAISHMFAREREVWNIDNQARMPAPERGYQVGDVEKIATNIAFLTRQERTWRELAARLGLQPLIEIAYEDMTADLNGEVRRLLLHIGVETPPEVAPPPKTIKLSGDGTREIKREFLRAIGARPLE